MKVRMSQCGACDTLSQSMTSQPVRFVCDVIIKDANGDLKKGSSQDLIANLVMV